MSLVRAKPREPGPNGTNRDRWRGAQPDQDLRPRVEAGDGLHLLDRSGQAASRGGPKVVGIGAIDRDHSQVLVLLDLRQEIPGAS